MVKAYEVAADVANKWGPALTKAARDGDTADYRALFVAGLTEIVVQNSEGGESCFTIEDNNPEATMDWKTFFDTSIAELKGQDYEKTASQCLGVLGPRCIMEAGRFNSKGEIYSEAMVVLTLEEETGLVCAVEVFSDANLETITSLAKPKA